MRAVRITVLAGVGGAIAVYFLGRLLNRSRGGDPGTIETPEPLRGRLERIRPDTRRPRAVPDYPGRRGRVVRAYLNLLRGAERVGFPRAPHETPDEFAGALAAAAGAARGRHRGRSSGPATGAPSPPTTTWPGRRAGPTRSSPTCSREPPRRRRGVVRDAETKKEG